MIATIIDDIIQRESAKDTNNPNDSGGRTKYGISEKWHPEAWKTGPPSYAQAVALYTQLYVVAPGFVTIGPTYLQEQLVDFGVLGGPQTAIQHFQKVLGVPQDGVLGPTTFAAMAKRNPILLNNQLVDDRVLTFARIVQKSPKDLEFLFGWQTRALSFRK